MTVTTYVDVVYNLERGGTVQALTFLSDFDWINLSFVDENLNLGYMVTTSNATRLHNRSGRSLICNLK